MKHRYKSKDVYPKVEAMYRRGCSNEEIMQSLKLSKIETLDIVQKIFAIDIRKSNRVK